MGMGAFGGSKHRVVAGMFGDVRHDTRFEGPAGMITPGSGMDELHRPVCRFKKEVVLRAARGNPRPETVRRPSCRQAIDSDMWRQRDWTGVFRSPNHESPRDVATLTGDCQRRDASNRDSVHLWRF